MDIQDRLSSLSPREEASRDKQTPGAKAGAEVVGIRVTNTHRPAADDHSRTQPDEGDPIRVTNTHRAVA